MQFGVELLGLGRYQAHEGNRSTVEAVGFGISRMIELQPCQGYFGNVSDVVQSGSGYLEGLRERKKKSKG